MSVYIYSNRSHCNIPSKFSNFRECVVDVIVDR